MKKIFLLATLLVVAIASAQDKMITKTGKITFEASVPAFEEVKGKNDGVTCVLNAKTGEIASLALMKGFRFKLALMEEHFNENYIESEKYPTATFSGKVSKMLDYTKDGSYDVSATGKFTVHGVRKERTINGKISVASGKITITSDFSVALVDHNIEVPSIVFVKIAQVISVKSQYVLAAYKK